MTQGPLSGEPRDGDPEEGADLEEGAEPVPWSFKIMLVLLAIYLAYRLWQGIIWVAERFL